MFASWLVALLDWLACVPPVSSCEGAADSADLQHFPTLLLSLSGSGYSVEASLLHLLPSSSRPVLRSLPVPAEVQAWVRVLREVSHGGQVLVLVLSCEEVEV